MTGPLLLLVEDSPAITVIVHRYSKAAGFEVRSFDAVPPAWEHLQTLQIADGRLQIEAEQSAICNLQSAIPVLLLLDVNLPGENGLELCARLRSAPGLASLPVVLFGSWDRPEDIGAGLRSGIDFVLGKELLTQPDAWTERVREILSAVDSRRGRVSLGWTVAQDTVPATEHRIEALNQALRHPTLLQLGPEVVEALLERVLPRVAQMLDFPRDDLHDCLLPGGRGVNPAWLARLGSSRVVTALADVLMDQVSCLLGAAASAAFRRDLAAALSPTSPLPR